MGERVAFLFPGQGSQHVGMGRALAERFRCARDIFTEADDTLRMPLSHLCFAGPLDTLSLTENTQPALLTCSWALTKVLAAEYGIHPSWAAGHSLGEFSALVAAGALRFGDALRVVRQRARAMQAAIPAGKGAMSVLLGIAPEAAAAVCAEAAQGEVVAVANFNGGSQVVIAGHRGAVERASTLARSQGAKRALPLPVSAPFHCSLMAPAAARLAAVLASVPVQPPAIPVVANVDATVYGDTGELRDLLVRQVVSPVRWEDCVLRLARLGCRQAIETGPGKVLTGLVKRITPAIACRPGENVDEICQPAA